MDLSQRHFERAAQHHATLSKCHRAIAKGATKSMGKAAKSDLDDTDAEALAEFLEEFIEQHNAIADEQAEMSEHCMKCGKAAADAAVEAAEKAAAARFTKRDGDDAIAPTGVRAVVPSTPPAGYFAVPRFGQKAIPAATPAPEFAKLFSAEDGETLQ
jgi:predicted phage gp36 major capsid-like protein